MAQIYFNGFESDTVSAEPSGITKSSATPSYTVVSSPVKTGSKALQINPGSTAHYFAFFSTGSSDGDYNVTAPIYFDVYAGDRAGIVGRAYESGGNYYAVAGMLRGGNSLRIATLNNTSESVKSTFTISSYSTDTWYHLKLYLRGTVAKLRYWADGDSEPSTWAIDTTQSDVDNTHTGAGFYHYGGSANYIIADDLEVEDNLTRVSGDTFYPDGDGDVTSGWRAEGGDYTKIDEEGANDGDTTRLYTPTAGNEATFTIQNSADIGASDTINSITVHAVNRSLDPVSNTFKIGVRIGSTNYWGDTKDTDPSTSYIDFSQEWTTNPATSSAWTLSELDSLQIGIQKGNAVGMACTQMYVEVDYTAGGGTDANDERTAKTTGKDTSNSERLSKLTGTDTSNSDRSAKLIGNSTEISERNVKTIGKDTSLTERASKITGKQADNSEKEAKLTGILTTSEERSAKTMGKSTDVNERSSKTIGKQATNNERSSKIIGTEGSNSERSSKLTGLDTDSSEFSAKLTGTLSQNSERGAKLDGRDTLQSERSTKIHGKQSTAVEISETLGKTDIGASNVSLGTNNLVGSGFTASKLGYVSKASLYLLPASGSNRRFKIVIVDASDGSIVTNGTSNPSSAVSTVQSGWYDVTFSNTPILQAGSSYVIGIVTSSTLKPVFDSNDTILLSDSSNSYSSPTAPTDNPPSVGTGNDYSAYLTFTSRENERFSKLQGQVSTNDSRDSKITGKSKIQSERSVKTTGSTTSTNERPSKIIGKDTTDSERNFKVVGKDTQSSERGAKLTGTVEIDVSSERGAKLVGTLPFSSDNPIDWEDSDPQTFSSDEGNKEWYLKY
jgi:hypothetical protein